MSEAMVIAAAIVVLAVLSVFSAGHALLIKRDPRSALGWIVICLTMPVVGPALYWSMGVNRINRRARMWHEKGRRLGNHNLFRVAVDLEENKLPVERVEHLRELKAISDRVVKAPLIDGNSIGCLHNGEEAYPAMLDAIRSSRHSINLSTYIFDSNEAGQWFINALKEASDRGVEVRVIVDGLGEKYSMPQARKFFKGSAVKIRRFMPLRQGAYLNLRNHRKVLIVDGSIAFTGGMNIGDRHMVSRHSNPLRVVDLHFCLEGPVVLELQRAFLEDWFFVSGELVMDKNFFPPALSAGSALARVIGDGPDKDFRKLECIIIGALACAKRRVLIMTPYFIPDRAMISALSTAAMRGIDVTLILPELNNLPVVHWATRAYLWELIQHDIRIMYQPPPFVHTKLFLVDDLWSLIGSANLDPRSLRLNFELNVEVYDREFTATLVRHFQDVLSRSRQITLQEMDSRPLSLKLRDAGAKLFSPYL